MANVTSMIEQYLKIKARHQDAILLFRMGDFYEMFYDDAKLASEVLGLTLTSREHGRSEEVPLAGIPHHAVEAYLAKLVKAGYKVAICEQVEDPKKAKGIVRREVVEVVTPGTTLSEAVLDERQNNYLVGICQDSFRYGFSVVDLSTGEFSVTELDERGLMDELERLRPAEAVVPADWFEENGTLLSSRFPNLTISRGEDWTFAYDYAYETLREHFGTLSLKGFGCEGLTGGIRAAGAILTYLKETKQGALPHISKLSHRSTSDFMVIDATTQRNLELTTTIQGEGRGGSLLSILDRTKTPMGGRLLRSWLQKPLLKIPEIEARLDGVEELCSDSSLRNLIREELRPVGDLERLVAKVCCGRANARDLVALKGSLKAAPRLREALAEAGASLLRRLREELVATEDLVAKIEEAIVAQPPLSLTEGGIIRPGYDPRLDELWEISRGGKDWIAKLQQRERERTGIASLKVGYNKVFGYYIEVTRPNLDRVPANYIRKQTMVNAERFITPELKEYEARVLGAEEQIGDLEYELFIQLRDEVAAEAARIQAVARAMAQLDVLAGLADIAIAYEYRRPEVNDSDRILITDGRHPVVERLLSGEPFVPNDTKIDNEDDQILIITGPNMSGKCLTGDTVIIDAKTGCPHTLTELHTTGRGIAVPSLAHDGCLTVAHTSPPWSNGIRQTFKLTLANGATIKATANHRFLTVSGWCELAALKPGDYIATPGRLNYAGQMEVGDAELKILGYMLGDGDCAGISPRFHNNNPQVLEDFMTALAAVGTNPHERLVKHGNHFSVSTGSRRRDDWWQYNSNPVKSLLRQYGLNGVTAATKFIPQRLFQMSSPQIRTFLGALYATDGYFSTRTDRPNAEIGYTSKSRQLVQGIQTLLLRLGLPATVFSKKVNYRSRQLVYFNVTIRDLHSCIEFCNQIQVPGKRAAQEHILAWQRHLGRAYRPIDRLPPEVTDLVWHRLGREGRSALPNPLRGRLDAAWRKRLRLSRQTLAEICSYWPLPDLEYLLCQEVIWTKIRTIEPDLIQEVYDLEVPETACLVANNIITHNSTYLRQVGLIVLMAQMGSFVPAKEAHIGVVHRIFTRVGASDSIAGGESTFLVEMNETANIIHNATPKSLVLLDEIGRGTSTFDGLSIAWAVTEYVHNNPRTAAKTLFATHYHELTELELILPRVKNYNVAVREWGDEVVFLRKIVEGGCDHSYGIQVARLAGLPKDVIERAKEVLANLEESELTPDRVPKLAKGKRAPKFEQTDQLDLFSPPEHLLLEELKGLDISSMTPLEALNKLDEWKGKFGPGKG